MEKGEDDDGEFDEIDLDRSAEKSENVSPMYKEASIDDIVFRQYIDESRGIEEDTSTLVDDASSVIQRSGDDEMYEEIKLCCIWKFFQVFGALFYTMTMCFIVIGYQNIRDVMLSEGIYSNLCEEFKVITNITINGTLHFQNSTVRENPCNAQIYHLGLMFTLGITFLNLSTVFFGPLVDLLGPKIVGSFGGLEMALGLYLFSWSIQNEINFYIESYIMIAVGGVICFLTVLHFQNYMHPKIVGFYNIFIMSSEDTCAGVFLLMQILYNKCGVSIRYQLWIFSILPLSFTIFSMCCQPWKVYPHNMLRRRKIEDIERERQRNYEEIDLLLADDSEFVPPERPKFWRKVMNMCCKVCLNIICFEKIVSFARNDLKNYVRYSFSEICCSIKFWIFFVYSITGMPITYFYMVTFREQLEFIAEKSGMEEDGGQKIEGMVYMLGILFIFVGIVTAIPVGCIISVCNLKGGFLYIATLYLVVTVVSSIHVLDIQYISMVSYIAMRCCFFALWNQFGFVFAPNILVTFLSVIAFSSSLTNLSNFLLQAWARDNYTAFNIAFGSVFVFLNLLLSVLSCYWVKKEKKKKKKEEEDEEEEEVKGEQKEKEDHVSVEDIMEKEMKVYDGGVESKRISDQQEIDEMMGLLSNLKRIEKNE